PQHLRAGNQINLARTVTDQQETNIRQFILDLGGGVDQKIETVRRTVSTCVDKNLALQSELTPQIVSILVDYEVGRISCVREDHNLVLAASLRCNGSHSPRRQYHHPISAFIQEHFESPQYPNKQRSIFQLTLRNEEVGPEISHLKHERATAHPRDRPARQPGQQVGR